MKIACIIPLRGGSKGVPRKNIKNLDGNPLCYYVIKLLYVEKEHMKES